MFGKSISKQKVFSSLILLLFCLYIIRLFIVGDINLYIHPRYSIFALVMAVIGMVVLVLGLLVKNSDSHEHDKRRPGMWVIDSIVVFVLVLAIVLPAQPLSQSAIDRKSVNTPTSNSDNPAQGCPDRKIDPATASMNVWVYQMSEFSPQCYEGMTVKLTGYVYESTDKPLPPNMYYIARVIMSCCVIDARPYALPVMKTDSKAYPKDTWLTVEGKLEIMNIHGTDQLIVRPTSVSEAADESDQPYQYQQ